MIYDIRHVTTYRYEAPVAATRCTLRLLPRSDPGQTVTDSMLDVTPPPAGMVERRDFFGNRVVILHIAAAYRELRIAALAQVAVERPQSPAPGLTPAWESVRREAAAANTLDAASPVHRLYPSRRVPLYAPATDYARASFPPGRPILEGAADLMTRIKADFAYDPKATAVSTPLAEAFAKRGGVCQDFAHIMIAGLRGLGLPAGYVSGYIRTHSAARAEAPRRGGCFARLGLGVVRPRIRLARPRSDQCDHGRRRPYRHRHRPRLCRRLADRRRDHGVGRA